MVSENWMKIGDIAEVFDGPHATPKKIEEGPYFLSISSLESGKLDLSKSAHLSEEQFVKWTKRVTPEEGDVLFSYETRLGEAALMPSGVRACLGRRMGLLRPNREIVLPEYLLYAYLAPEFQQEIKKRTVHGATVDRLALKELPDFNIRIPSIEEQRKIVRVLKVLDQKIQLNRQTNQTLENMAQALFKSWFVDFDPVIDNALAAGNTIPEPLQARAEQRKALRHAFDQQDTLVDVSEKKAPAPLPESIRQLFPDGFVFDAEMGWIPEGWEVKTIHEATELIIDHRGKTPKKLGGDWSESGYPAISAKNIKSGQLVRHDTIRFVEDDMYQKWMKQPLQPGDIAMTSEAPLGELYYFAEKHDYLLSQRLYGLRANEENCSGSFLYFWLQTEQAWSDMEGRATGTTVVGIRQSELRKVNVMLPSKPLVDEFSKYGNDFLAKVEKNNEQNSQLESIRDTLLPKLISGKLRLPTEASEAQQQTKAAVA